MQTRPGSNDAKKSIIVGLDPLEHRSLVDDLNKRDEPKVYLHKTEVLSEEEKHKLRVIETVIQFGQLFFQPLPPFVQTTQYLTRGDNSKPSQLIKKNQWICLTCADHSKPLQKIQNENDSQLCTKKRTQAYA